MALGGRGNAEKGEAEVLGLEAGGKGWRSASVYGNAYGGGGRTRTAAERDGQGSDDLRRAAWRFFIRRNRLGACRQHYAGGERYIGPHVYNRF